MARASRADVARMAGVAPSTVSNILNGRAEELRIAPATVERVVTAAADLSYVPQAAARTLRGRSSHTVGLLLGPLPANVFVPVLHDVVTAAIAQTQARAHLVVPFADPGGEGTEVSHVERVLADVDLAGVVAEMSPRNAIAGELLHQMDVPVVWTSFGSPDTIPPGVGIVVVRETRGVEQMLNGLEIGVDEEIAVVRGPGYRPERLEVPLRMFEGRVHMVEAESWLADGGAASMRWIREELPQVRTVFCADDYIAYGALHELKEQGLSTPDDYSIVGFGGFESGAQISHELTTVRWPIRELTITALDALIDHTTGVRRLTAAASAAVIAELQCEPVWGTTARLKA